jgi:hypothetical protein
MFGKNKELAERLKTAKERIEALKADKERLRERMAQLESRPAVAPHLSSVPLSILAYNADGLSVWGKNLSFLKEARFLQAYGKGARSGHHFGENPDEIHVEWRVHVILWAAGIGLKLEGDFVECGVNTGIYALAIAEYHRFAESGRTFHLFDTFRGTPEEQMAPEERENRIRDNETYYPDCYETAKANFAPYPNFHLIRGRVPDTLADAGISKVAYLSIDMNVASAEIAALEYFWDKLAVGAVVVLDDYGWETCETQYAAHNAFAEKMGTSILALPTGQGILIKH